MRNPARPRDETRLQILLLMHLRWLAILAQALCTTFGIRSGFLEPRFVTIFIGLAVTMAVFNLTLVRRFVRHAVFTVGELFLHLIFDLIVLSFLLLLSGGLWNPLAALIYLHAVLGAWFLKTPRLSTVFLLLVCGICILLGNARPLPIVLKDEPFPNSLLYLSFGIVLITLWTVVRWLRGDLARSQARLQLFRDQRMRMDHLRAVGAVASGFAHEFATPLNTVRMRLERALRARDSVDPNLQVALQAVEQCEQTLRALSQTRTLSPESLSLKPVQVTSFVTGLTESWRIAHPERPIKLRIDLPADHGVLAPQLALAQSLLSLIDNAFLASETVRRNEIEFNVGVVDGQVEFEVLDSGEGFPAMVLEKFGEPFVTVRPGGTGLGLFNAVTLARALGGTLEVSNRRPDPGARVSMRLPSQRGTFE